MAHTLGLTELIHTQFWTEEKEEAYYELREFIMTQADVYSQENLQQVLDALNKVAGIE